MREDYEDLVKRLRQLAEEQFFDFERKPYLQAADAIEDLKKAVLRLEDESGIYDELPAVYIYPTKWIPVTERLPEKHEWVLVRSKLVRMKTDFISNDGSWYTTPGVTHWMPLPEPPKDGE